MDVINVLSGLPPAGGLPPLEGLLLSGLPNGGRLISVVPKGLLLSVVPKGGLTPPEGLLLSVLPNGGLTPLDPLDGGRTGLSWFDGRLPDPLPNGGLGTEISSPPEGALPPVPDPKS